jgi:hypothetical protein
MTYPWYTSKPLNKKTTEKENLRMYLLNLMFDPDQTDGRFAPDVTTAPALQRSKVWLELQGGADPSGVSSATFNPETLPSGLSWAVVDPDGSLLTSKSDPPFSGATVPPFLAVRIAPVPTTTIPADTTFTITVIFGREPRAQQPYASPFTLDNTTTGANCAVFNLGGLTIPSGQSGVYFPLRPIANAPASQSISHHYEFEIGLIVDDGVYTFGHDPELDVGM